LVAGVAGQQNTALLGKSIPATSAASTSAAAAASSAALLSSPFPAPSTRHRDRKNADEANHAPDAQKLHRDLREL